METSVTNDYIHDVQLPTFHVIRQTFLTSYSSLYTSQPHQAHTCYSHAQTHTKDCIILAQCWIISFMKDYYGIYLVKWINTEVFFNCNVNIFTVSNTILYSLRIELETIDIGEKHTTTFLLPDCALAVHSSMSACDSMQAAITLTCMARNSLTL